MRVGARFLLLGTLLLVPACKQGSGERCQIDDDCESGLECSKSEGVCRPTAGGIPAVDAAPAVDARSVDARSVDASAVDSAPAAADATTFDATM